MNRFAVLAAVLSALATGCASTTVIRSTPAGAVVRDIRGQKIGKTPYTYSGNGMINSIETFTLEKPGYEEISVTVKRDQVNGLAMAGWGVSALLTSWTLVGLGLAAGMLWSADYPPVYNVELDPAPAPAPPEAAAPAPTLAQPQPSSRPRAR